MASRSCKNCNPGNIRFGKFAQVRGAVDDGDGYAKWTTPVQGLAAMVDLLAVKGYRELTLAEAINRYAPKGDNNQPHEYAGYVAQRSGVSLSDTIGDLGPFQLLRVLEAMIRFEGWAA
jgi:hypothetical protein